MRIDNYDSAIIATTENETSHTTTTTNRRKRSIEKDATVNINFNEVIRERRDVNNSITTISDCCEPDRIQCKCDFTRCQELECPSNEYKRIHSPATKIPGKCCPEYVCTAQKPVCYSQNLKRYFNQLEKWDDDACTSCECSENGEKHCEISHCRPLNCEKKQHIDGQCCPVCDISDSKFCQPAELCDIHCLNGFLHDSIQNCSLCRCAPSIESTKPSLTDDTQNVDTTNIWTTNSSGYDQNIHSDSTDTNTKSITDDNWLIQLPIILGICITIAAFAIIMSLTCRHITHHKDKHHFNRKQNMPLI